MGNDSPLTADDIPLDKLAHIQQVQSRVEWPGPVPALLHDALRESGCLRIPPSLNRFAHVQLTRSSYSKYQFRREVKRQTKGMNCTKMDLARMGYYLQSWRLPLEAYCKVIVLSVGKDAED